MNIKFHKLIIYPYKTSLN